MKNIEGGVRGRYSVHVAGCCSPARHKDEVATKDILSDGAY